MEECLKEKPDLFDKNINVEQEVVKVATTTIAFNSFGVINLLKQRGKAI